MMCLWQPQKNFISSVNPTMGKHILTVVDAEGNSATKEFEIIEKEN
jgi:hypothetical protein